MLHRVEELAESVERLRDDLRRALGCRPGPGFAPSTKQRLRLAGLPCGGWDVKMVDLYQELLRQGYTADDIVKMNRIRPNASQKRMLLRVAAEWLADDGSTANSTLSKGP